MNKDRLILFFAAPWILAAHVARGIPTGLHYILTAWKSFGVCPAKCPEEAEPTPAVSSVPVRLKVRCPCCAYSGPDDGRDCTCVEGCPEG